MKEKIKITSEFLAELKEKVKIATQMAQSVSDEPATNYNTPVISTKWIEEIVNEQDPCYIIALNHAVILAMIEKIEEDASTIKALRYDEEINELIREQHYNFLDKLQKVLGINLDDKLLNKTINGVYADILSAIKELKRK